MSQETIALKFTENYEIDFNLTVRKGLYDYRGAPLAAMIFRRGGRACFESIGTCLRDSMDNGAKLALKFF